MTDGGVPVSRLAAPRVAGLDDLDQLAEAAAESEGVIHLAYSHGSPAEQAAATDRHAIDALGEALAGSGRPFVVTGGTLVLPAGRTGSERDRPDAEAPAAARGASEPIALALSERSVRASVIRLAPCVHDRARRGFAAALIDAAQRTGVSAYLGDGSQRWPAVHRQDAAALFRSALESTPPGQSCTVSARREYARGTSPSSSGPGWACPSKRSRPTRQPATSPGSETWSEWTPWRPVSSPASSWTGVPHTPGCSTTWQQVSSSPARRDTGREPLPGFDRPACPITRDTHVGCRRIRAVPTASAAGLLAARFVQHGRTARHAVRPRLRWVCSGSGVHVLRTQATEVRGWLDRACAQAG